MEFHEEQECLVNAFHPGDYIKCYIGLDEPVYGKVTLTVKDLVLFADTDGREQKAHYKACRRLVPKHKKVYWIKKGDAFSVGRGVVITEPTDPDNWIKLVEAE